jgi:hypothetical protein
MTKTALLIGINYFNTSSALNGCINDIETVTAYLVKNGYSCKQLRDDKPDALPTAMNILNEMMSLTNRAKAGDSLFFHYSGHGTQIRDLDGDEKDGMDECICPSDYQTSGVITDDLIRKYLVDAVPENVSLFALMDCCNSGTNFDMRYNVTQGRDNSISIVQDKSCKKPSGRVVMISGCRDDQTSADAYISGEYRGAMTTSFINTINNSSNASYKSLIRKMRQYLRNNKYSQVPQLASGAWLNLKEKFSV